MEWKAKEGREGGGRDRKYGERKRKKDAGQWTQHPRTWRTQEEKGTCDHAKGLVYVADMFILTN